MYTAAAIAVGLITAVLWAHLILRRCAYWEFLVWLPGVVMMLVGVLSIDIYDRDVVVSEAVNDVFEIQNKIELTPSSDFRVIDGDTIAYRDVSFRLKDIDAPEADQCCRGANGKLTNCGAEAAKYLQKFFQQAPVVCTWIRTDRDGRPLASCTGNGKNLNAEMVIAGYAIAYRVRDRRKGKEGGWRPRSLQFYELEKQAKAAKRGLHRYSEWVEPHIRRHDKGYPPITGCT